MKPERLVYHTICSNLNRIKYNSELDRFRPYTGSLHNKITAPIFCFLFVVERSILRVKFAEGIEQSSPVDCTAFRYIFIERRKLKEGNATAMLREK